MTLKKEKNPYLSILILFIITRIVLFAAAFWLTEGNLKHALYNFDIEHYLDIAQNGYKDYTVAFFPLIPMLMRFFNLFGIPVLGTMIVNNIAALLSAFLLYKLTNNLNCTKLFLCSPIAVFTFIAYTESLFILLTLLVLYLYKNEKYFWAGICLGLGVTCRSLAAMLFFSVFIVMAIKFFKKELSIKSIFKMYIPATLLSLTYPVFLQIKFGNWKAFMDVQYDYWWRMPSNLITTIIKDVEFMITQDSIIQNVQIIYHFILLLAMITLIVFAYKKLRKTKDEITFISIAYLALSILSIYSTCRIPQAGGLPSASFYRYFYGCISVYILPTIFGSEMFEHFKNKYLLTTDIFISLCFAAFYFLNIFMC